MVTANPSSPSIRRGSVSRAVALPTGLEPDRTFEHGVRRFGSNGKPRQIRISPTVEGTSTSSDATPVESSTNGFASEPATAGGRG